MMFVDHHRLPAPRWSETGVRRATGETANQSHNRNPSPRWPMTGRAQRRKRQWMEMVACCRVRLPERALK